ncbi:helix-turn-helix transcriptional regulator [Streptomyces alkaliterrae]|uniref:LuxR family transcriptional regulator n=1 Tax=Streptomyces alkaliterrae TaxID=2213162 RepID=A0A5P0YUM5_9ACTN|nr:LuxR C-terminal-related transcriptional regulator [Streptomyces alkaliterrae]MBB1253720.1 LuxR family transcriptional regulator [Streptomyces alkaliterrae]MBB1257980.1 LuxR family transcriptional regulator [Streptomyces alkaliterrae]MQS03162.1 LuxR family transcriptional regulator [Streptomyces alkaliterrae]
MDICDRGVSVYREALRHSRVTGEVPQCVVELGLLRQATDAEALVPVPPDVALFSATQPIERTILDNQHRLAALRVAVSRIESVYLEALQGDALVRRLVGPDVISAALEQAVGACTTELLTMQPGGGRAPVLLAEALTRDLDLAVRGVRQRTLYQHSIRTHGPTLAYVQQVTEHGAEVRTAEELFERLIVCDRAIAFIPSIRDRSTEALAIRHPGIVRYLVRSFEHVWHGAEPVALTPGGSPDPLADDIHRAVLRLLVSGFPDKAIAKRLGISLRSVANHVRRASDSLGSRSRAELGYLLAVRGIVRPGHGIASEGESESAGPHPAGDPPDLPELDSRDTVLPAG